MTIYWSFFIWIFFWGLILISGTKKITIAGALTQYRTNGYFKQYRTPPIIVYLIFGYMVFFIGLRSDIGDTLTYILVYNHLSVSQNIFDSFGSGYFKGWGYTFLSFLVKKYISTDFHVLFMLVAIISGFCIARTLSIYSKYLIFSSFLFVVTTEFTWMLNGIRQFLAVSIIFASFGLLLKNKTVSYILIVLLASTIHFTAIIMIPIYFIVRSKPWSKQIFICIFIMLLSCAFISRFDSFLNSSLNGTSYSLNNSQLSGDDGVNPIRVLIDSVTAILAFWKRQKIQDQKSPLIDILVNISVMGGFIDIIGIFTSGILIGRLPIYLLIYNLILLPWIIHNCFGRKEKTFIILICSVCYLCFFYYQMVITWGGLIYVSDVLNLNY